MRAAQLDEQLGRSLCGRFASTGRDCRNKLITQERAIRPLGAAVITDFKMAEPSCTAGMKPLAACLALAKKYRYRPPLEPAD